ncbi:MAG: hypothetical protein PHN19_01715 [Patescibacteria group bacterium]|nr:hypothetical protein [Patescibacteria group bacterium]
MAGSFKIVDIPLEHPLYQEIIIDRTKPKRFVITLDLSKFPAGYSGNIKLSFHLDPKSVLI